LKICDITYRYEGRLRQWSQAPVDETVVASVTAYGAVRGGAVRGSSCMCFSLVKTFLFMGLEWSQVQYFCGLLYHPLNNNEDNKCGATSGINDCQGKPKYSEENLPQCRSGHHRTHMTSRRLIPGKPQWEIGD
jgi:hypothetical protein